MKKILAIFLTVALIFSLAGCSIQQTGGVLEAWTGDYSEAQFKNTIQEYHTNYTPIVAEENTELTSVSFKTDFKISSCAVHKVSFVDSADLDAELSGGIYLNVETTYQDKEVTVSTNWWYNTDDWTHDYTIWSYLVRVMDTDGVSHYYYFRTNYSS